jgi:maleylacetoacetate isomerase
MKLYTFWRSTAAYRVRIVANLKAIPLEYAFVNLARDGGEHNQPAYRAVNPTGGVPSLETDAGAVLTQSLAIIEYLDERFPQPPLLPGDALARARAREIALLVVADLHPLNTPRILKRLAAQFGADGAAQNEWIRIGLHEGFAGIEALLQRFGSDGRYCLGDAVTLADVCLVPQVFNAHRFDIDLTPYPLLAGIEAHCLTLPAFAAAHPNAQPDVA